ncbi:MAG: SIMPL domain-containing protein [Cohaesibacter sp.]|nr:SIMPL domain-containing protein [Cohaesibacter sp.]
MKRFCITLAAILPLISTPTLAGNHQAASHQAGTLSISGIGKVDMVPDLAIISAGVESRAKTTKDALADNSRKMAALFATLEKAGIAKKDMQTSNFNIYPQMHYPNKSGQTPPKIIGYHVNNQLTVRIRDLAKIGTVLTALVDAGANNMSGLRFDVADKKAKLEEARIAALADAKAKASLYAAELGSEIKRLKSLSETSRSAPRPVMMRAAAMKMEMDAAVPVAEGSMSFSITINTVWELNQ